MRNPKKVSLGLMIAVLGAACGAPQDDAASSEAHLENWSTPEQITRYDHAQIRNCLPLADWGTDPVMICDTDYYGAEYMRRVIVQRSPFVVSEPGRMDVLKETFDVDHIATSRLPYLVRNVKKLPADFASFQELFLETHRGGSPVRDANLTRAAKVVVQGYLLPNTNPYNCTTPNGCGAVLYRSARMDALFADPTHIRHVGQRWLRSSTDIVGYTSTEEFGLSFRDGVAYLLHFNEPTQMNVAIAAVEVAELVASLARAAALVGYAMSISERQSYDARHWLPYTYPVVMAFERPAPNNDWTKSKLNPDDAYAPQADPLTGRFDNSMPTGAYYGQNDPCSIGAKTVQTACTTSLQGDVNLQIAAQYPHLAATCKSLAQAFYYGCQAERALQIDIPPPVVVACLAGVNTCLDHANASASIWRTFESILWKSVYSGGLWSSKTMDQYLNENFGLRAVACLDGGNACIQAAIGF